MSTTIGYSSELYFIEPQDIQRLADTPAEAPLCINSPSEIVVLLGNAVKQIPDTLACGRAQVEAAISAGVSHIPVRFAFVSNIASWNILPVFFKGLRKYFKYTGGCVYHTTMTHLRALHIERGFRNAENAYVISKRWHISPQERVRKYNKLLNSMKKKGFDDRYPLSVMLCRRCGIKDCVDDGHHRIGICMEHGIERIAICFRAAGALPRPLQKLGLKLMNLFSAKS